MSGREGLRSWVGEIGGWEREGLGEKSREVVAGFAGFGMAETGFAFLEGFCDDAEFIAGFCDDARMLCGSGSEVIFGAEEASEG